MRKEEKSHELEDRHYLMMKRMLKKYPKYKNVVLTKDNIRDYVKREAERILNRINIKPDYAKKEISNYDKWEIIPSTTNETRTFDPSFSLEEIIYKLDQRKQNIVRMRLIERLSFSQIGKKIGLSKQRAQKIYLSAIKVLSPLVTK